MDSKSRWYDIKFQQLISLIEWEDWSSLSLLYLNMTTRCYNYYRRILGAYFAVTFLVPWVIWLFKEEVKMESHHAKSLNVPSDLLCQYSANICWRTLNVIIRVNAILSDSLVMSNKLKNSPDSDMDSSSYIYFIKIALKIISPINWPLI